MAYGDLWQFRAVKNKAKQSQFQMPDQTLSGFSLSRE